MTNLQRRLNTLEQAAWDQRKRQILRVAFEDVVQEQQWMTDRLEREVQTAIYDFEPMEFELNSMCRQGKTADDDAAYIAAEVRVDVDEILADIERSGPTGRDRRQ